MIIERSAEAEAFLAAIARARPQAVSACSGWTTHEIAAHVAGIAVEVTRHLDPYFNGDPVPATRSFEEREAPLVALNHQDLLRRVEVEEERMRATVADVLAEGQDAIVPWTGRTMSVAKFIPHLRNEHAVHRWDIAGGDELSEKLLGQVDLLDHSIGELGQILLKAGRKRDPHPDSSFVARLRTANEVDLRVVVESGSAWIEWAENDHDEPSVDMDARARHLFIWGRRPDTRDRMISNLPTADLERLQTLLSGY